ncbi:MAG: hypothetical protein ACXW1E_08655 [Halobacteriota archaeon]
MNTSKPNASHRWSSIQNEGDIDSRAGSRARHQQDSESAGNARLFGEVLIWDRDGLPNHIMRSCIARTSAGSGPRTIARRRCCMCRSWWAYELVFLLRDDSDVIHASDFDSLFPAILAKLIGKRKLCYLIYDFYTDNLPDGGFQGLRKRIRWFVAYLERTGIGFADVLFLVDESRLLRGDFTLKKHGYKLFYEKNDPEAIQFLETLRRVLVSERAFLLRLLENPNLLEQEAFTEQLRAVFHLADELQYRTDLAHLPGGGYRHLAVDA